MTSKHGPEKRKAHRKRAEDVVEFYDPDDVLLLGIGRLRDVSTIGALVESALRLTPGQGVRVRLRQGTRAPLERAATIVRVQGKGAVLTYGLRF